MVWFSHLYERIRDRVQGYHRSRQPSLDCPLIELTRKLRPGAVGDPLQSRQPGMKTCPVRLRALQLEALDMREALLHTHQSKSVTFPIPGTGDAVTGRRDLILLSQNFHSSGRGSKGWTVMLEVSKRSGYPGMVIHTCSL